MHLSQLAWGNASMYSTCTESDYFVKTNVKKKKLEKLIRSATELNEAGIQFRTSESKSLKDISFRGGVLSLPCFEVDDATESKFLNLIYSI